MAGLLTETLPGAPDGMNVAQLGQDIADTEAQYIQDALVDYPGLVRRRGPVQAVSGIAQPTRPVSGLVATLDPAGADRRAALNGDSSAGYFSPYSDDDSALVDIAWPFGLPANPPTQPYSLVDTKPALTGGALIGVSSSYDTASGMSQALALWLGGNKADYSTGTLSVSRGGTAVTGSGTSWSTTVAPGMFLFANTDDSYTNTLVGYVKSVNSNTSITLGAPSPYPITGRAYSLKSLRGVYPKVTTGRITCDTNTPDLNGGNTKFRDQGLGTGSWNVYRTSDGTWIGKVSTVESDSHLTLAANAAIAVGDEAYTAIRADGDWTLSNASSAKPGFITAQYAGRQWFLNNGNSHERTYQLAFSEVDDFEALDLTADGNHFSVGSSSIVQEAGRGLMASSNALLIFKESETFALFGNSPSQFDVKKLADDGALSGMSIQPYGGGVIWAGRSGVHFYDGTGVMNLLADKFGDVWKNSVRSFNPSTHRMYSMLDRDHYILHIEDLRPTIAPTKGTMLPTITSWVVVINMNTQAVTLATNIGIRGAVQLSASSGKKVWYAVNDDTQGYICATDELFDSEGVDEITCAGMTVGPDFYFESKKFSAGDSLRLKKFKLLALHYMAQGGDLSVDVVLGLNNFGKTLSSTFPASVMTWDRLRAEFSTWDALGDRFASWHDVIQAVFLPKRVKFQKQSQHMSFRVYQSSADMPRVKIGPYQIGYKIQRAGRV